MSDNSARVTLLERDSVTPEAAQIYDALLAQRGVVPNMFKVLAHNPASMQAIASVMHPTFRSQP